MTANLFVFSLEVCKAHEANIDAPQPGEKTAKRYTVMMAIEW
jgi:hypothetical protein